MRNTTRTVKTVKHVGIITTPLGEWDLYDQYPTNRRDYKITSAVPRGKPTCGVTFASDAAFERWLMLAQQPVQRALC